MPPRNANPEPAKRLAPAPGATDSPARMGLPPLDLVRGFEAAARLLSFTRAADELALTQSAVSRQIQALEAHLGVELFERRHRALALTEAGRILQRAVTDSLERLRDATERIRTVPSPRLVGVTTTPGFAALWLIPRLARFSAANPEVDVRISATNEIIDMERAGIDIGIRFVDEPAAEGRRLFGEEVFPVCAPALLKDPSRPLKRPEDLKRHVFLAIEHPRASAPWADWTPWLVTMGLPDLRPRRVMRFMNYNEVVAAAISGQGVAIGRLPLIEDVLRDGQLVPVFEGRYASPRAYYVIQSPRAARNADAQAFMQWLFEIVEEESREVGRARPVKRPPGPRLAVVRKS